MKKLKHTAYTDYKIDAQDRHIMITARSEKAVAAALTKLFNAIEALEDGYGIKDRFSRFHTKALKFPYVYAIINQHIESEVRV